MLMSATWVRRALVTCALGGAAAAVTVMPTASAADPCSASNFSTVASGVLASAGGYLDAHPEANNVLTAAASQAPSDAQSSVRGYFLAHPGEFLDLRNIVSPLQALRNQCGVAVSPSQLANLFDALNEG
jgi:hemophore-related protein